MQRGVSRKFPTCSPTAAKGVKSLTVTLAPDRLRSGMVALSGAWSTCPWGGMVQRGEGLSCGFEMHPPAFEKQTGCLAARSSSALLETELLSSPS